MKKILITSLCAMVAGMLCAADQNTPGDKGQKTPGDKGQKAKLKDEQKQEREALPGDKEKKAKLTDEQKQELKALIEKYDINKDGKLDKDEMAKMSREDKDKWQQLKPNAFGQSKGEKKGGGAKNTK